MKTDFPNVHAVCPHCKVKSNGEVQVEKVIQCDNSACSKYYVLLTVFCPVGDNACQNIASLKTWIKYSCNSYEPINENDGFPLHFKAVNGGAGICSNCDRYGWGVDNYILLGGQKGTVPFDGYLIVPVENYRGSVLFHGTKHCFVESILCDGLRVPENINEKVNGLPCEGTNRYAAHDYETAKSHGNVILQFEFSGYVAITTLECVSSSFDSMFERLPEDVCAIQYVEGGRSVVFNNKAKLHIPWVPENLKTLNNWKKIKLLSKWLFRFG